MTKSYRLKTKLGVDQNIRVNINQDFDFLEILSLKLRQEDVYTRFCSDYGIVVGRVVANGGFGVPNVSVSIFVPLSDIDEEDPVISTLYPYKFLDQKNEDGYRYNLLPYVQEYNGHNPTGTFPSREDVLTRKEVLEIYEKYYKYTVKTNDSGDFMIVGVPLGSQKIVLDLDLSNMGCFSLRPADLIRMGRGTAEQFDGDRFKSSSDLASLPQLVNTAKDIDVTPFWGENDVCNIGITRVDFDLRDFNIDIKPQATFMGSIFSTSEEDFLRTNCKPKKDTGNLCDLVNGPGRILAIRQTKDYDVDGRPVLEQYNLEDGGKVIDDNGTWLVEVPMNLDYVVTNEFGEQVLSTDPTIGVPTKGRYRFRIQYQNESGLSSPIQRADYLIPNVKEWGWGQTESPTTAPPLDTDIQLQNYAFSLDWADYGDTGTTMGLAMIEEAINCEDRFYEFNYNKVYTVSSFIDRWKWGFNRSQHLGIKEITNRACSNSTNRFPVNDGVRNFDFIFFLFNILITLLTPVIYTLIILAHILAFLYPILRIIVNIIIWIINVIVYAICVVVATLSTKLKKEDCKKSTIKPLPKDNPFKRLSLPMMSFPDCEACPCESSDLDPDAGDFAQQAAVTISSVNVSLLANINSVGSFIRDFYTSGGFTEGDSDSYNAGANQLFSGYQRQGTSDDRDKLVKLPIVEVPGQGGGNLYLGADVTLAQSLNLMNLRSRYFDGNVGPNRIQTTVKNTHPITNVIEPSEPFEDNLLIILCDPGTLSNLPAGQLLTFNDLENINDPNITGLTVPNQFNSNTITGSTPYNTTQLVQTTINSVNPGWGVTPKVLKLKITENGKEYKFKAGTEYFQVLTGDTCANYRNLVSQTVTDPAGGGGPRWDSILNEYLFKKIQSVKYGILGTSFPALRTNVYSTSPLLGFDDFEIIFLTKGTDPYTQKQRIEYDLSKIFGYDYGVGPIITGDYYLNIPIQDNSGVGPWHNSLLTPEWHDVANNTNTKLYHEPFGFNVDTSLFTAFTNNSPHYYNSTDKSRSNHVAYDGDITTLGLITNQGITSNNDKIWFQVDYVPPGATAGYDLYKQQGLIEGGSVQASTFVPDLNNAQAINTNQLPPNNTARTYSPAYHLETLNNPNITITANNRLVFRSDRLPTSDITESYGNTSFSLHLNDNFGFYLVDEDGIGILTPGISMVATDNSGNYQNLVDDENQFSNVVESLSCDGMVPLKCYQGSGIEFAVTEDCEFNKMGKDDLNQRVEGGCYYFVDNPLIASIPKDIKYYEEWKSRFRFQFAACRGVIGHVFQNNWVNGTLYMFSFKNAKRFTILGELKRYKYCGDPLSYRPNQGPIVFTFGTTNSFFYRSTPYNYQTGRFVGQLPKKIDLLNEVWESASNFKGMNEKNIFFPTTVADLGPRDQFTKEICFNPQFEGYLVDSLRSTSFNDIGDTLQLFILSRLINSNFWGQALNLGDASINRIFSRTEDRIDGDYAQMASINSEYGVDPFNSDDYDDGNVYVENSNADALFGIFFSSDTSNRRLLSPGATSYTNFGYPKTQIVPMYKWKSNSQTTIFGDDKNDWVTNGPFYSQPYQSMDFTQTEYFKPANGEKLGYIYNRNSSQQIISQWPNGQDPEYVVGAPYHFYFGLNKGKSSLNRYITKYIFNQ